MKNKSARHKEDNTFKFQPFNERVSNIDVDIFHKVEHQYETQTEEEECHLFQSIQKWNVLNLSECYDRFRKDVQPHNIVTLPELLHRKDEVIEVLIKHLQEKDTLCLQPLLEFVISLVKDLRKEFYPYYPRFFNLLLELLQSKDTEQLEWAFQCLAYIFKYLWRSVIKDISSVFVQLLPLLSDTKPEYINNFAAESFAFVARKVRDKKSFLELILKVVQSEQDGIAGCGKLFYEVTKGIDGQLHSYAEEFIPFLFESLVRSPYQDVLYEILEYFLAHITSNIHPTKCDVLWTSMIAVIQGEINDLRCEKQEKANKNLHLLLNLLGEAIESKNGKLLQNPLPVIDVLKDLIKSEQVSESLLIISMKISIVVLLSPNIKLPQEHSSSFMRHIIALNKKNIFYYFVENIVEYGAFEALILPAFLKQCVTTSLDRESFQVLTKVLLKKAPLCFTGINLISWKKYDIDFNKNNEMMEKLLLDHLNFEQVENYLCALICLPHFNITNEETFKNKLECNIKEICNQLENDNLLRKLFLLNMTVEAAIHFGANLTHLHETLMFHLLPLANDFRYLLALKILDLYYTANQAEAIVNLDVFKQLNISLEMNFNSPFHDLRLLTSHIYTIFEKTLINDCTVFSLCYKVESIKPQVDTYRMQLQILEKLDYTRQPISLLKDTDFISVPIRYLCGVLYMNFKLLWDPVASLIASFANGITNDIFWNVFVKELKDVAQHIRQPVELECSQLCVDVQFVEELYKEANEICDKPDFANYRILLWKAMCNFPQLAEAKTRDTSELLLDFISNEYVKSNTEMAATCNIKQFSSNDEKINDTDILEEENDIVPEEHNEDHSTTEDNISESIARDSKLTEQSPNIETKTFRKLGGRQLVRTLVEHLKVFSKIRSPKSLFKEPEINKLYYDFLSHKSYEVQKIALDCLLTYKPKYLLPYQSYLYDLIDDKNFKNALVMFKVDKDSNIVQQEHREQLMPIVMRIVFSKMFAKIGLKTGGKSSGQFRRTLVLRFLAGCHENEMLNFIQMTFKFYTKYFHDDCEIMVDNIINGIDLEKFIPLKRLQSSLNLINVVIEQFGGLMSDDLLRFVLKITLVIGAFAKGAFDHISDIHNGYLTSLRNIRSSCIKIIERFFHHFEHYPWAAKEINAVFSCFVFPTLHKLPMDGIHSATPLLKLFILWGSIPHYSSLLIKHEPNCQEKYPLIFVMQLLVNDKCNVTVVNSIMEMIEKLLSLKSSEEEFNLPVENLATLANNLSFKENLNYGSCILLPHISYVLEKIRNRLKSKTKGIHQKELFILSRVSELVFDADISDTLLELLLPIVLKKCNQNIDEEVVLQYTLTILNLLKNVKSSIKHIKQISPLFGEVTYPSGRKVLCDILKIIAEKNETVQKAYDLAIELNACDAKWIDQPDYQRRLDAFKEIQRLTVDDSAEMGIELAVILIYNCLYVLKSEKDISLKESATYCLKTLVPIMINKYKLMPDKLNYLLEDILFPLIRSGLRSKLNDYRNDCISLLGVLARECSDTHAVLRDLNKLTNKLDMEVDFFENIIHLQLHRHIRALFKFMQTFKEETTLPTTRTLTQFILPLTTNYLCNDKYVSKNSMIDAAIETVGVVCKLLPWHQYEGVLKFYLNKLRFKIDFQRQLVRLIVTILDAFHYDLQKGFTQSNIDTNKEIKIADVPTTETENDKAEHEKEVDEALETIETSAENVDLKEDFDEENDTEDRISNNIENVPDVERPYNKITLLCKSTACKVIRSITVVLLPQLHKSLAVLTHHDSSHKVNRKKTAGEKEEEDLLKVPISLALVKLLQKLPKRLLEANLPGIFMKLCTFLKSQLESVRRAARETFQKIMLTIGPDYLNILLEEIVPLMTRGFQVHVLVYTLHAVLTSLKELYKPGDIDKVLLTILDLCKMDLFGSLGEEKEVAKIISKTSEAKSTKSCDTLQIVAQFVTEKCLMDLLIPIKNVLVASHSFKVTVKLQDCLRHIALGLIDNKFIALENLLKFTYGVSSESIPELIAENTKQNKIQEKLLTKTEDCLLIPKEPVYKSGYRINNVKKSAKTNSYILIEFGLRLCFFMLKRDMVKELDFVAFMDPFVDIFKKCLSSQNIKLSTISLNCLCWTLKYELPTLKSCIKDITELIFAILHKYAAAGLSKGDNFDLVVVAFKAMTVIVRDVKYYTIETEQLKVLLLYVEQDLHNHEKQATAFGLLKAIIARKLIVPELNAVMKKVAELSIISEAPHVRLQSRLVFHQYLMDYPLGKRLEEHISFYLKQLNYEMQFGRESALDVIENLINSFPYNTLKFHSTTFLVALGARLINDESPECKKQISNCLTMLFKKLQKKDLDSLVDIILLWFNDEKISHKRLAAQLCGIIIQIEKSNFESRLAKVMPIILSQFGLNPQDHKPGQFVMLKKSDIEEAGDKNEDNLRAKDHHIFLVLQMLLKLCSNCPTFLKDTAQIEILSNYVQTLLAYPHEWVRLAAAQFLGYVLTSLDVEHLGALLNRGDSIDGLYLHDDPQNSVKALTLDLIAQLQPGAIKTDFAEQVIKNLVFIARLLQRVEPGSKKIDLFWLTKKMRRIVNTEVVETPNSTILRTEVFKWIAAIVTALDLVNIKPILNHLMAPLVREMATIEESNAPLRQLSKQVANMIKKRIGMEEYADKLSKVQQHLSVKRAERKRNRNQLAVTDPEIYAKKKIKRHEKKKEAKKRKITERKGSDRRLKRRKIVNLEEI